MSELQDNIEFSESWLLEQIIKQDFKEKETKKVEIVKIKKVDLYRLVLHFVKLNKRGE